MQMASEATARCASDTVLCANGQCACPSHPLSVACLPKETRHPAACCVPRTIALSSALSAPLSALRSQRCALSAALSSSRSPPLPAMTTTYAPRAARVCLPALNLSQRAYTNTPCACGLAAVSDALCTMSAASPLRPVGAYSGATHSDDASPATQNSRCRRNQYEPDCRSQLSGALLARGGAPPPRRPS